jgi:hypothetical protein
LPDFTKEVDFLPVGLLMGVHIEEIEGAIGVVRQREILATETGLGLKSGIVAYTHQLVLNLQLFPLGLNGCFFLFRLLLLI